MHVLSTVTSHTQNTNNYHLENVKTTRQSVHHGRLTINLPLWTSLFIETDGSDFKAISTRHCSGRVLFAVWR
jgi:hypothetical protein